MVDKSQAALKVLNAMMDATGASMEDCRAMLAEYAGDPNKATEQLLSNPFATVSSKHRKPSNKEERRYDAPAARGGRGGSFVGGRGGRDRGFDRDRDFGGRGAGRGSFGAGRGTGAPRPKFGDGPAPSTSATTSTAIPESTPQQETVATTTDLGPAVGTPPPAAPGGWGSGKGQTMADRLKATLNPPKPEPPKISQPAAAPVPPPQEVPPTVAPSTSAPVAAESEAPQPTDEITAAPTFQQSPSAWGDNAAKSIMSTLSAAKASSVAPAQPDATQTLSSADNVAAPPSSAPQYYSSAPGLTAEAKTVTELESQMAQKLNFGSFQSPLGDFGAGYGTAADTGLTGLKQPAAPAPAVASVAQAAQQQPAVEAAQQQPVAPSPAADAYAQAPPSYSVPGTYTLGGIGGDQLAPAPAPVTSAPGPVPVSVASSAPSTADRQVAQPPHAQGGFGQAFSPAVTAAAHQYAGFSNFGQAAAPEPAAPVSHGYDAAQQAAFAAYSQQQQQAVQQQQPQQAQQQQVQQQQQPQQAQQQQQAAAAYGAAPGAGYPQQQQQGSSQGSQTAASAAAYNPTAAANVAPGASKYAPYPADASQQPQQPQQGAAGMPGMGPQGQPQLGAGAGAYNMPHGLAGYTGYGMPNPYPGYNPAQQNMYAMYTGGYGYNNPAGLYGQGYPPQPASTYGAPGGAAFNTGGAPRSNYGYAGAGSQLGGGAGYGTGPGGYGLGMEYGAYDDVTAAPNVPKDKDAGVGGAMGGGPAGAYGGLGGAGGPQGGMGGPQGGYGGGGGRYGGGAQGQGYGGGRGGRGQGGAYGGGYSNTRGGYQGGYNQNYGGYSQQPYGKQQF